VNHKHQPPPTDSGPIHGQQLRDTLLQKTQITRQELSQLWRIPDKTLERWAAEKTGPRYFRLGGKTFYRPEDILAFEQESVRNPKPTEVAA
jgi:hypothetical protein